MEKTKCLAPVPPVAAAVSILESLGIELKIGPGWSLIALTAATIALAYRPGRQISVRRRAGSVVVQTSGGTRVDYPSNIQRDLSRPLAKLLARSTCELCGRPACLHHLPGPAVLCDSCAFMLDRPGQPLPFQPRLPLLESARNAADELEGFPGLDNLPAGWAERTLLTVQYLRGLDPAGTLAVEDLGTHLDAHFHSNADEAILSRLRASLASRTAAFCRHCGRPLPHNTPHPGECAGCVALHEWGDETVDFDPKVLEP